ncbi:MAG TPA: 50S ribosomal protein L18 [bacterium]|nr:50S ribosomal protein L18 [bacterium]HPN41927.1 50S ribosomal protein L18 [bacterium]
MADLTKLKALARSRRREHISKSVVGTSERPRLVVFRSNKQIYAQIIDDVAQQTLTTVSSISKELAEKLKKAKTKKDQAKLVGKFLAEQALEKKISKVVFDRAGYLYHGRVKALAEGAREGGLKF